MIGTRPLTLRMPSILHLIPPTEAVKVLARGEAMSADKPPVDSSGVTGSDDGTYPKPPGIARRSIGAIQPRRT